MITKAEKLAIAAALGDLNAYAHQCHAASLELVRARIWDGARVARGWTARVTGQHSWVAIGNPYAPKRIIDPTVWSYTGAPAEVVDAVGRAVRQWHPHGEGNIFDYGKPCSTGGPPIELTPAEPLSRSAEYFLGMLGHLDARGWIRLAGAPVQGWPAAEIISAMLDTPALTAFVPIDIAGMLTDRNPQGLYLPETEAAS